MTFSLTMYIHFDFFLHMKKGIFLIIAISLWFIPLYGQGVYVTISAEMDSIICENQLSEIDSSLLRLKITYDNRTNDAVYFAKVGNECRLDDRIGVPRFLRVGFMNPPQTEVSNIDYSNDEKLRSLKKRRPLVPIFLFPCGWKISKT